MANEIIMRKDGKGHQAVERKDAFSAKKRSMFLNALARTCNIKRSADYAGIHQSTPYRIRREDPVFAAQMREALEIGRERLTLMLLEHGGAGEALDPPDPCAADDIDGAAPPPFDFDRAVAALKATAPAARGETRGHGFRRMTSEETNTALLKALDAQRRREAKRGS